MSTNSYEYEMHWNTYRHDLARAVKKNALIQEAHLYNSQQLRYSWRTKLGLRFIQLGLLTIGRLQKPLAKKLITEIRQHISTDTWLAEYEPLAIAKSE